jgi:glyceraldehyde 3-phosphate dehydrogenase
MATKVAINGFGRIGRLVARAILARPESGLELVAINDLADAKSNALLFKRDSVHGPYPGEVKADGNDLIIDGKRIKVTAERDPANLPHAANGIDIALECTGFFTDAESAGKHLTAGAKRVLISAPAKGVDLTVVFGVNNDKLTADHKIVSNASCTTNCLAPIAKVLNDVIGIERGLMTTIHAYTNDQKILDQIHNDGRRPRGRRSAAGTEGQARRLGDPRPDPERLAGRSHLHAEARHLGRGSQRSTQGGGDLGSARGHPSVFGRAAGFDRLQPQSRQLDGRQPRDCRPRRQARPRRLLVRQ